MCKKTIVCYDISLNFFKVQGALIALILSYNGIFIPSISQKNTYCSFKVLWRSCLIKGIVP